MISFHIHQVTERFTQLLSRGGWLFLKLNKTPFVGGCDYIYIIHLVKLKFNAVFKSDQVPTFQKCKVGTSPIGEVPKTTNGGITFRLFESNRTYARRISWRLREKPLLLSNDTEKRTSDPFGLLSILTGEPDQLHAHELCRTYGQI